MENNDRYTPSVCINFRVLHEEAEAYYRMRKEGRIKRGELSKILRDAFYHLLESHRGNAKKSHAIGYIRDNESEPIQKGEAADETPPSLVFTDT